MEKSIKAKGAIKTIIALSLIFLLVLSGCSKNPLKTYNSAVEKTENITRGKFSVTVNVENIFNKEGLDDETLKTLRYLEKIETSMFSSFDKNESRSKNDIYLKIGNLGFDSKVYSIEDEAYIQIPALNKYIKLNLADIKFEELEKEQGINTDSIEGLMKRISKEWTDLLETDNVVKGERTIMQTEDGDVKVTKFSVSPTEDQLRLFLKKVIAIFRSEKEGLQQFVELFRLDNNYNIEKTENNEEMNFEILIKAIENELEEMEKITFSSVAYIDIDGYIVKETIEIVFENYDPKGGQIEKRKVQITQENWDNEMEQKIILPEIPAESIISIDDFEGMDTIFMEWR
jgi:hypothetical protein